ncbi:hypothetical protein C7T35_37230 [Variovorax sp. WS11]|nr:hypothetical protein C7T35_37230 [Variovorax sp. WS11]
MLSAGMRDHDVVCVRREAMLPDMLHELLGCGRRATVVDQQAVVTGGAPTHNDCGAAIGPGEKIDFITQ